MWSWTWLVALMRMWDGRVMIIIVGGCVHTPHTRDTTEELYRRRVWNEDHHSHGGARGGWSTTEEEVIRVRSLSFRSPGPPESTSLPRPRTSTPSPPWQVKRHGA